ncbi:oxytocin receptor-like [Asterias amurensis]|uniref:oxytocin receptor-like n=1 Tax=Asterias amurensis TaxID=7602 RepID=UPI003AB6124F
MTPSQVLTTRVPVVGTDTMESNISQEGNATYGLMTTSTPYVPTRDEQLAIVEVLITASIFVLAIFGNTIVIAVLWRRRKSLSRMHYFIIHLCIADLTVAFLYTLPQMLWDITYKFYAPDVVCRLVKYFQLFPVYLSTYILVMTAIDRYLAICHPLMGLRRNQTFRMRVMVLIAWGIAVVCSLPQLALFKLKNRTPNSHQEWMDCRGNFQNSAGVKAYITFFTMAIYVIPSLILAAMYGMICLTVWKNMGKNYKSSDTKTPQQPAPQKENNNWEDDETDKLNPDHVEMQQPTVTKKESSQKTQVQYRRHGAAGKVSRAKIKTVKMTLTIVTVYVVTWAPFFVAQMLSVWTTVSFDSLFFAIALLLTSLTSCINPWIYFAFSSNAGRDIKQTFGCLKVSRQDNGLASDKTHHDETSSRFVSTTGTASAHM